MTEVSAGQEVIVDLTSSDFQPNLYLINSETGELLRTSTDSGLDLNSQLTFTIRDGINYVISVSTRDEMEVGSYGLSTIIGIPNIQIPETVTGTLTESDATVLNTEDGGIHYVDDFELSGLTAGKQVTIDLISADFDTYLYLINADSVEIIQENDDGGIISRTNSRLSFTVQEAVNYVIRVSSWGEMDTGSYNLGTTDFIPLATIQVPEILTGMLSESDPTIPKTPEGDTHYINEYKLVRLTAGQQVTIDLTSSDFDTYLYLINAGSGEIIQEDDDGGSGRNSSLTFTIQQRVNYIIRVSSFGEMETGAYSLYAH